MAFHNCHLGFSADHLKGGRCAYRVAAWKAMAAMRERRPWTRVAVIEIREEMDSRDRKQGN